VQTKAFLQPSPDTSIILRPNLPTSSCPTLSAGTGPISQNMDRSDFTNQKFSDVYNTSSFLEMSLVDENWRAQKWSGLTHKCWFCPP